MFNSLQYFGYLIIRESVFTTPLNCILLDLQHAFYACISQDEMSCEHYVSQFSTEYIREEELRRELELAGFCIISLKYEDKNDKFQKVMILCQKKCYYNV